MAAQGTQNAMERAVFAAAKEALIGRQIDGGGQPDAFLPSIRAQTALPSTAKV